jgi:hypothetical protein
MTPDTGSSVVSSFFFFIFPPVQMGFLVTSLKMFFLVCGSSGTCLHSKHKALSSTLGAAKKKKNAVD